MMVDDHTKGGDELKQAVAPHGVELSSELPDDVGEADGAAAAARAAPSSIANT